MKAVVSDIDHLHVSKTFSFLQNIKFIVVIVDMYNCRHFQFRNKIFINFAVKTIKIDILDANDQG